jgi:hypothetical protein
MVVVSGPMEKKTAKQGKPKNVQWWQTRNKGLRRWRNEKKSEGSLAAR